MPPSSRFRETLPRGGVGLGSGCLLALAVVMPGWGLLAVLALVPLLLACLRESPRRAAFEGWLCGLVFFAAGFGWVLVVRGAVQVPVTVYAAGVAVLACFVAGFAATLAWLTRRCGPATALLAAPGLWAGFEWLRSLGPQGVPWLWLGSSLAEQPLLIQAAAGIGSFGLSAWLVALAAAGVGGFALRSRAAFVALAGLAASVPLYGLVSLASYPEVTDAGADGFRVAAVQPNVPEEARHDPRQFHPHLRRLLGLSHRVMESQPDLVVWPETAYERPIEAGDPFLGAIANGFGRPLLTGVMRIALFPDRTVRNAVVMAAPGGEVRIVADKLRPVPVYESAPPAALATWLGGWWPGRTRPGSAPGLVRIPREAQAPLSVGVLVCFDASFTDVARRLRLAGARLLIGLYNEAQSGPWVARQQELFARLRAVENRVPVVRVANTGRSVWIDAAGRTRLALGSGAETAASLAVAVPARPLSLYSRWGDAPVLGIALFVPAVLGLRPSRGRGVGFHGREPTLWFTTTGELHDSI